MRCFACLIPALLFGCEASEVAPATPPSPVVVEDRFETLFGGIQTPIEIDVEIGGPELWELRNAPREWVDGTVVIDGERHVVEMRLKGHGSFSPIEERPSLKLKFDQGWYGHEVLILNNYLSDDTRVHERLATEFFHRLELPAARAGHAYVSINGDFRGLYGVLEDVDPIMVSRWFDRSDGALYEMFDGDFQPGLTDGIEHEAGPEVPELIAHITSDLSTGNVTGYELAIEHFDARQFLEFWAMTAMVGQTDAFPYSLPGDDVYLYLDPETEQFHFMPHGLDEAFLPRQRTLNESNGMLARRCLAQQFCREELETEISGIRFLADDGGWDGWTADLLSASQDWRREERVRLGTPVPDTLVPHLEELETWFATRWQVLSEELTAP